MQLKTVAIENFKSLQSSGTVRLKPLTVIIGSNGSGKSSLLEAVETYRRIILSGLDAGLEDWGGIEQIRHKSAQRSMTRAAAVDPSRQYRPMRFTLNFKFDFGVTRLDMAINSRDNGNVLYFQNEEVRQRGSSTRRDSAAGHGPDKSILAQVPSFQPIERELRRMLFLRLNPAQIGALQPTKRTGGRVQLRADGANSAEYLIDLRERSASAYDDVMQAMRYVLPYATEVQPRIIDSGVARRSYLQLLEGRYEIPGWLMSTGSLRALPLVATLLDPDPPPVVFIEEIENGLDPRTIGLMVDLLKGATASGRIQVVATTHSPYLLDQLDLADVLLCERTQKGPKFSWPAERDELEKWRQRFMPGRLYTMNVLQSSSVPTTPANSSEGEAPNGGWGSGE